MNIKQITNYDLDDLEVITKTIDKGGDKGEIITHDYKIIDVNTLGGTVSKIGYCCEIAGIMYPIFLTVKGQEREFQIGKTGMFEFQPEKWRDINVDPDERYTMTIKVSEVKVPVDIGFTLDYCY